MKKIFYLLLMLLIAVLFSACATVSLNFYLDEDNSIDVLYTVGLTDCAQPEPYLNQLSGYWNQLGFETQVDAQNISAQARKQFKYETSLEAAQAFAKIVTSDDILLYDVELKYNPAFEYDNYSFSACVSLKDIVRQNQAQDVPSGTISEMRDNISQGSYSISVRLPGEVLYSNAANTENNTCTWVLNYGSATQLSMQTQKINTQNIEHRSALQNKLKSNNTALFWCIVAGAIFLAGALSTLIIRRIRIKRVGVVRAKKFR